MVAKEFSDFDRAAMTRALELAARGIETTRPNPRVGCVIARREKIVGEGWHERAGEPHAEVLALRAAGKAAEGATAYITLEPCNHHGRTPPCVDALFEARVARVVFAVEDPNTLVSGKGAAALRAAGITVQSGLMQVEATELNAGFIKRMQHGRPWVRLKSAMSLDGRTALASGVSQWITSEPAREDAQRWRARSSAVLTGIGTVLVDNPRLTVRSPPNAIQPLRVVLDSQLRTPPSSQMFDEPGDVLLLTTADFSSPAVAARAAALEERGAKIEAMAHSTSPSKAGGALVNLVGVLSRLSELEVNELLVEAGPVLTAAFLSESLADEWLLYVAPKLLGPQARSLVDLPLLGDLKAAQRFEIFETQSVGGDLRLRLRPEAKT